MSNLGSYEERINSFDWSLAEKELEYRDGEVIKIGWYCSDLNCLRGKGEKTALLYEYFTGIEKAYTFNDLRLAGNDADLLEQGGKILGKICEGLVYIRKPSTALTGSWRW